MKGGGDNLTGLARFLPDSLFGWIVTGLLLMGAIVAAGGVLGSLLYPVFGSLLGMKLHVLEMAANGLYDGAFYALIWAPGISLVLCIMAAHHKMRMTRHNERKPLDTQNKDF